MATLVSEVATAVEDLESEFSAVVAEADDQGGAYIAVGGIETDRWIPEVVTIEFRVLFNYPHAAIYPFYTTPDLRMADLSAPPPAIQKVQWRDRAVTQISLSSPNWNPKHDTALAKVKQVRRWLQTGEL